MARRARLRGQPSCKVAGAVGIAESPDHEATQRLLGAAMAGFRPHQVIAYGPPSQQAPAVPLLDDPGLVDGQPAVWLFS